MNTYLKPTYSWSTSDELKIIDFIASDEPRTKGVTVTLADRKEKLRGYIKSCQNRYTWGAINQKDAESYAQCKLAAL